MQNVHYFYSFLTFNNLSSFSILAETMQVTPLRRTLASSP